MGKWGRSGNSCVPHCYLEFPLSFPSSTPEPHEKTQALSHTFAQPIALKLNLLTPNPCCLAGVPAALERLLQSQPKPQPPSGVTVADWLETWLRHKAGEVRETTLRGYRQVVSNHLEPLLGQVPLEGLQPRHIGLLHQSIRDKGLGFRTLEYAHVLLSGALDHAVRLDVLPGNVAQKLGLPRGKTAPAIRVWTLEQARQFLEHLNSENHRHYALFHTALGTGMRRGELAGLRWGEVDLEAGLIRVSAQVTELKGGKVFSEPKTRASRRVIAISLEAVEVLRQHKTKQEEEKIKMGGKWKEHDLVFPTTIGTPIDSGTCRGASANSPNRRTCPPSGSMT